MGLDKAAYDIHVVSDHSSNMKLELFGHALNINTKENCITLGKIEIPISANRATHYRRYLLF